MPHLRLICLVAFHLVRVLGAQAGSPLDDEAARKEVYWQRLGIPITVDSYFRAAAALEPGKPIGEYEAYVLANAYFQVYFGLCGGAELPKDRADHWEAETAVGYWGKPGNPIIIEKKTGATYSAGQPKVADPRDYRKYITDAKLGDSPSTR